jgi:putative solute:sodium symporter small subunit
MRKRPRRLPEPLHVPADRVTITAVDTKPGSPYLGCATVIRTRGALVNSPEARKQYWRTNLKYLSILLAIWFVVSYGFGILLVDQLDRFRIAGFPVGFWFAQQGSIYVFIVLIFVYVRLMNRLDKRYDVDEET